MAGFADSPAFQEGRPPPSSQIAPESDGGRNSPVSEYPRGADEATEGSTLERGFYRTSLFGIAPRWLPSVNPYSSHTLVWCQFGVPNGRRCGKRCRPARNGAVCPEGS